MLRFGAKQCASDYAASSRCGGALAFALVAILAGVNVANGQTSWMGTNGDVWADTDNWSAGVPGSATDVLFGEVVGGRPTAIAQTGADALLRNLTHTGAHDYSVSLTSHAYMFYGDVTMTGAAGNGSLSLPFSGGLRLSKSSEGGKVTNDSAGAFTAHSIWYQGGGTANRAVTITTGNALATVTTGNFQKRYGYNDVDLLKMGPGVLTITGAYGAFSTSGSSISGLTGKVTIAGGTLRITSGNEDSLGRYNAGEGGLVADVLTLDGGTLQVSTANLTIDDVNRGITLGPNGGGFNVDAGRTLTIGAANVITGPGSLTKTGEGVLTVQALNNTYQGATTVEAGLLNFTGLLLNNGPADILIRSAGTSFGANDPRIARYVPVDLDMSTRSVGSSILGGDYGTSAELLAGTASVERTVTMAWRQGTEADTTVTGRRLISDVLDFEGTGTDAYVLQMSYDPLSSYAYLAWLDGGYWVNAVEGNAGVAGGQAMAGYAGSWDDFTGGLTSWTLDSVLGTYGFDSANSVAWAVLNHSSQFAVVPEPGTWLMFLSVLACMLLMRRR